MASGDAPESYVAGVDVGGTNTRALVTSLTGELRGQAKGGAGNPIAHGAEVAAGMIVGTVREAIGALPADVARVVVCGAGSSDEVMPGFRQRIVDGLAAVGVRAPLTVRSDLEAGFASGTADEDGFVLVAGTGAVTGRLEGNRLIRPSGGEGWLLGDDGGGFWFGREAIRAALSDIDRRGPKTVLTERVTATLGIEPERDPVMKKVYELPPMRMGALAPLVTEAYACGDAVAVSIVESGAAALVRLVRSLDPEAGSTLVMIGGVVAPSSPVTPLVTGALPELETRWVRSGTPGATWLALKEINPAAPVAVHTRLAALG